MAKVGIGDMIKGGMAELRRQIEATDKEVQEFGTVRDDIQYKAKKALKLEWINQNNEIKEIYDNLETVEKKCGGRIDVIDEIYIFLQDLVDELAELELSDEDEKAKTDLLELKIKHRIKSNRQESKEEKRFFIDGDKNAILVRNRKKIFPLKIDEKPNFYDLEIQNCISYDMSFEQLLCYIYWRSCLRNNRIIDAPRIFMTIYVKDLGLFLDGQTPQENYSNLLKIYDLYRKEKEICEIKEWMIKYLQKAMNEVKIFYSDSFSEECIEKNLFENNRLQNNYMDWNISKSILRGDYGAKEFDYLIKNSAYKIYKSDFYIAYNELISKCIQKIFPLIIAYFKNNDLDIITLWVGKPDFKCWGYETAYFLDSNLVNVIEFHLEGFKILIDERGLTCSSYTGYDRDEEYYNTFYRNRNVFKYFFWHLESVIRKKIGFKNKLRPSVSFLRKLANESYSANNIELHKDSKHLYNLLADLYESEDYCKLVDNAVDKILQDKCWKL